ncbi:DUF6233 domain-containing protein [Streptomyces sp. NBC_01352]
MWLQRIDAKIAAVRKRQAEQEHGRRTRPRPADWVVQLGIGAGRPPVQIHTGDCYMKGTRLRPVDRNEARSLLTAGLHACTHCQPDVQLHILDLVVGSGSPSGVDLGAARLSSVAELLAGTAVDEGCYRHPDGHRHHRPSGWPRARRHHSPASGPRVHQVIFNGRTRRCASNQTGRWPQSGRGNMRSTAVTSAARRAVIEGSTAWSAAAAAISG